MSRDIAPFGVRMPAELKELLTSKSKENKRSLNSEVVSRLEETIRQDEQCGKSSVGYETVLSLLDDAQSEIDDLQSKLDRFVPPEEQNLVEIKTSLAEIMAEIKSRKSAD